VSGASFAVGRHLPHDQVRRGERVRLTEPTQGDVLGGPGADAGQGGERRGHVVRRRAEVEPPARDGASESRQGLASGRRQAEAREVGGRDRCGRREHVGQAACRAGGHAGLTRRAASVQPAALLLLPEDGARRTRTGPYPGDAQRTPPTSGPSSGSAPAARMRAGSAAGEKQRRAVAVTWRRAARGLDPQLSAVSPRSASRHDRGLPAGPASA
jgi:hypothetical protein